MKKVKRNLFLIFSFLFLFLNFSSTQEPKQIIEKINYKKKEKFEPKKEITSIPIPEKPKEIKLFVGESRILSVRGILRTAVGNPSIADILVISENEILINGKSPGTTNINVWHKEGRTTYEVLVSKEPLATTVEVFPLKNLRLQIVEYNKDNAEIITKTNTELISDIEKMLSLILEKDKFTINPNLNNIVVQATEKELEKVKNLLQEIDRQSPQIMIETKVMEVSDQDLKSIGARWNLQNNKINATFNQKDNNISTTINFTSLGGYTEQYISSLEFLESKGRAKTLANPKMIAQDGKTATIVIGERVPIVTTTMQQGNVTTSAEYIPVGIILGINPKINQDNYITTFVLTEVSSYYLTPNISYPFITSKQAESEIRVKDGEGIVIGGLLSSQEVENISKVPILGDIPVFGDLFKKKEKKSEKKEVIIILVPHIISN
jgi:type II secretory pathway component GspD/PulD (secretin)